MLAVSGCERLQVQPVSNRRQVGVLIARPRGVRIRARRAHPREPCGLGQRPHVAIVGPRDEELRRNRWKRVRQGADAEDVWYVRLCNHVVVIAREGAVAAAVERACQHVELRLLETTVPECNAVARHFRFARSNAVEPGGPKCPINAITSSGGAGGWPVEDGRDTHCGAVFAISKMKSLKIFSGGRRQVASRFLGLRIRRDLCRVPGSGRSRRVNTDADRPRVPCA